MPIVNNVPGAIAIQGAWEKFEWLSNPSMPGAYSTHLRMSPLAGSSARPFLIHIARGEQSVPNPQTADLIDAGLLADRVAGPSRGEQYEAVLASEPGLSRAEVARRFGVSGAAVTQAIRRRQPSPSNGKGNVSLNSPSGATAALFR
ncbi:MAG: hypothetical protein E6J65_24650 [Deltaproteobacteria bacterium]|nr:MAG: hypothetical protein E6J65_24650 [Deltaproteobacteria bacterium]